VKSKRLASQKRERENTEERERRERRERGEREEREREERGRETGSPHIHRGGRWMTTCFNKPCNLL